MGMSNKDKKNFTEAINDLIRNVAAKNDIEIIEKNGTLMVNENNLPRLTNAIDTYLGKYKVV